ncbi:netrin-1-like X2, partial [Biomphalaria pfeifferi]
MVVVTSKCQFYVVTTAAMLVLTSSPLDKVSCKSHIQGMMLYRLWTGRKYNEIVRYL